MDIQHDRLSGFAIVTVELPGLYKHDIGIDVHCNRITVHGETKPLLALAENFVTSERRFGNFSRSFEIPEGLKVRCLSKFLSHSLTSL